MIGPSSYISKFLLTLLFILIGWYIYMDCSLYMRIQYYKIERNYHNNVTIEAEQYNDAGGKIIHPPVNSASITNSMRGSSTSAIYLVDGQYDEPDYSTTVWIPCKYNPLCYVTVKALMLDQTNHYLFGPMATMFEHIMNFSKSHIITPNAISFFHVFVAIAGARLIATDSIGYRRIGVVLFQIRTFLDDLDGHVARVKKNIRGERSEIGTAGFYIDGICDGLGCIALMIGVFVHLRNNPPRRGYTQLQPILPVNDSKNSEAGIIYKVKVTTKKVARKVLCFSGLLLLSSTGWNRYIALYQDMLERNNVSPMQFLRQNIVFKSKWFFSVCWLWRIGNVHALLDCLLLSIFCDKLWEFLRTIQYAGFVCLLIIICFTEMHVLDVQNFIYKSLTGNDTAL